MQGVEIPPAPAGAEEAKDGDESEEREKDDEGDGPEGERSHQASSSCGQAADSMRKTTPTTAEQSTTQSIWYQ